MPSHEFLDPSLFAQVKNLYLAARYVAEGAIGGFHASPYVGYNAEFSHHREYIPGDEIRHVDWKRYAKSGKFYVKQYEESSSLNALLVFDQSASMRSPATEGLTKDQYGKILIAALAYILLHQRDGVGFVSFAEKVNQFLPISTRMTQFGELVKALDEAEFEGKTSFLGSMKNALKNLKKRSLVILVSDFLDQEDEVLEAIRMIRFHKHEILAFHLLTRDEYKFPYDDLTRFVDLETGQSLTLEPRVVRQRYQDSLQAFLKELKSKMEQYSVDYNLFQTSVPLEKALTHFLYRRSRHA